MLLPIKLVYSRRARKNGTILYTYIIVWVLMNEHYYIVIFTFFPFSGTRN